MTKDELLALWQDDAHWRGGLYRCVEDPRVIVPKRVTWGGWTVNFSHPMAWPAIGLSILIAVGPVVGLLLLGVQDARGILAAIAASIAVLIVGSHYLSGRTHPDALPRVILAVVLVVGPAVWACWSGRFWLALVVVFGVPLALARLWGVGRE